MKGKVSAMLPDEVFSNHINGGVAILVQNYSIRVRMY